MNRTLRSMLVAVATLVLSVALAGGTLIGAFDVGPGGSPVPSGPWYNTAGNTWISKIWTPLVTLNEDASGLTPQLATGWSANDDFTVWTFALRQGVSWHDGAPFTAADVKFTWEWVYAPGTQAAPEIPPAKLVGQDAFAAGQASEIAGLEVVDDYTVRFTTADPAPRFPNTLINIELKPDPEGAGDYEARLAGLLAEFERGEEVIVASFLDLPSIRFKNSTSCIATAVPTVQVAAFILTSIGPLPGLVLNHQAFQVPMELGIPVVTPNFIRSAHQNNVAVHVWTINDCAEMAALLEMGVDGIMTDRPGLLHRLLVEGQCPD